MQFATSLTIASIILFLTYDALQGQVFGDKLVQNNAYVPVYGLLQTWLSAASCYVYFVKKERWPWPINLWTVMISPWIMLRNMSIENAVLAFRGSTAFLLYSVTGGIQINSTAWNVIALVAGYTASCAIYGFFFLYFTPNRRPLWWQVLISPLQDLAAFHFNRVLTTAREHKSRKHREL
jgi:hypothetical protein